MGNCPSCNTVIEETDLSLGEIIPCPGCGSDLEVISQDPLIFEVYEQEEK